MDNNYAAYTTMEMLGEIWDEFSGWEKAGIIVTGALLLLSCIPTQENTGYGSSDIPTYGQIQDKKKQVEALEKQIEDMKSGTVSGASADQWKNMTEEALTRIKKLRHELFAPGAVTEIRDALSSAEEFHRKELHQAANQTIYQVWQLARMTEIQVLEGEKAWEEAAVTNLDCYGRLQQVLDTTSQMPVEFYTDGPKETLTMDVDFWSEGKVSQLRKTMPEKDLPRSLTTEQVKQRTQQLRDLAQRLSHVIVDAVDAFRMSQQRLQLCDAVYASFVDRGWMLDEEAENGFEKKDPRRDACLNLHSASMDKLEFIFSGASRISLRTTLRNVHNQGLSTYFENVLRQVLSENGFTLSELTSSI